VKFFEMYDEQYLLYEYLLLDDLRIYCFFPFSVFKFLFNLKCTGYLKSSLLSAITEAVYTAGS
jgi:hypothetical protein